LLFCFTPPSVSRREESVVKNTLDSRRA